MQNVVTDSRPVHISSPWNSYIRRIL